MTLPSQNVTLTVEQINALNRHLADMRHDINNNLSLIMAATELLRHKPQTLERMVDTLVDQPPKVTEALRKFSAEFEKTLGLPRSSTSSDSLKRSAGGPVM
jgi:hypothetical protein